MEVSGKHHTLATLPPGNIPNAHLIKGWVGPRAGLDVLENRKISCLYQDSNPVLSSPQPSRYTGCAIQPTA
jgi:hypothetical protein